MDIIDKFGSYIYFTYGLQITDALTISKLALNILFSNYLKNKKNSDKLPLINNPAIYQFIKQGYYGGITDVYIPSGENLNYFDINSMYPFVALNEMPGNKCTYVELQDIEVQKGKSLDLNNLFGFFFCKVKTNNGYLGLLPVHGKDKSLNFPNGEFEGIWFSKELKFAKSQGYEIQVIKGYKFNTVNNIFKDFVEDLYQIRMNESGIKKIITKLILNSAFGRFGMSIFKPITELMDTNKLQKISVSHNILDTEQLSDNLHMVTYESELSIDLISQAKADLAKVVKDQKNLEKNNNMYRFVSIATAAAITSYARIYITKIKLLILEKGGKIFYSDTDSIVTDIDLPDNIVGKELGKFKLEYKIKKAIFVTGKTYLLLLENGQIIKKAKGVNSGSLSSTDYENMYLYSKNVEAEKNFSTQSIRDGTVNIYKKTAILNFNSYKKREKIFNKEGL